MSDLDTVAKLLVLPMLVGLAVGVLWRGRWLTMAAVALVLGSASIIPQGDWSGFRGTWNSSHFVWFAAIVLLSLALLGGTTILIASLTRWLKLRICGKR
jgi:hypothetical protein